MQEKTGFSRFWEGLSQWLHTADLIPVVIVVSTYHYFGALRTHDPLLVAFPIALFVDLLHYRSVSRAVVSGGWWRLAAFLTTAMAFGLQYVFYSEPGADGSSLGGWAVLYASLVPVGLAIMAMLTQAQVSEKVRNWAKELADMAAALKQAQEEAAAATAAKQEATAAQQAATAAKLEAEKAKQEATAAQQAATLARQEAEEMKRRATLAKREAEAAKQEAIGFWHHLNPRTKAALHYLSGKHATMDEAAVAAKCHKSTISKHVAALNHNGGK